MLMSPVQGTIDYSKCSKSNFPSFCSIPIEDLMQPTLTNGVAEHHRSHSEHEQFRIVSHVSIPPSPAREASVAGPRYSVFNVLDFDATGDGVIDDTQNM
ncbi:hypothetical protein V6N13_066677 [Hibiscus sabdariffa]|uniref:Uncharacterized protein n=1 Tax=Hibiscus sabdariffa TaxID=183260 RepID=A0ABR2DRL6_9ROSI